MSNESAQNGQDGWRFDEPPIDEWVIAWVREMNNGDRDEYWTPAIRRLPKTEYSDDLPLGWSGAWHYTYAEREIPGLAVLAWRPGPDRPLRLGPPKTKTDRERLLSES